MVADARQRENSARVYKLAHHRLISTARMPEVPDHSIQIGIDRGGTFSDVYASWPSADDPSKREELVFKLLSKNPGKYEDGKGTSFFLQNMPRKMLNPFDLLHTAPREGVRRVLSHVLGVDIPRDDKFATDKIGMVLSLSLARSPC
jgi:5-oxoprolinase (ATP-hydrolysing)